MKKEASKFWHWKKTSETGKAVNNKHGRYVNMMSRISLGFLAYIYISEYAVSVVMLSLPHGSN